MPRRSVLVHLTHHCQDNARMNDVFLTLRLESKCTIKYLDNCSRPVAKFPFRNFDDASRLVDALHLIAAMFDGDRRLG